MPLNYQTLVAQVTAPDCTIEELDLSNQEITDAWIRQFLNVLKDDNHSVKRIDLRNNHLTNKGASYISYILRANLDPAEMDLIELNLEDNHITNEDLLKEIKAKLARNRGLLSTTQPTSPTTPSTTHTSTDTSTLTTTASSISTSTPTTTATSASTTTLTSSATTTATSASTTTLTSSATTSATTAPTTTHTSTPTTSATTAPTTTRTTTPTTSATTASTTTATTLASTSTSTPTTSATSTPTTSATSVPSTTITSSATTSATTASTYFNSTLLTSTTSSTSNLTLGVGVGAENAMAGTMLLALSIGGSVAVVTFIAFISVKAYQRRAAQNKLPRHAKRRLTPPLLAPTTPHDYLEPTPLRPEDQYETLYQSPSPNTQQSNQTAGATVHYYSCPDSDSSSSPNDIYAVPKPKRKQIPAENIYASPNSLQLGVCYDMGGATENTYASTSPNKSTNSTSTDTPQYDMGDAAENTYALTGPSTAANSTSTNLPQYDMGGAAENTYAVASPSTAANSTSAAQPQYDMGGAAENTYAVASPSTAANSTSTDTPLYDMGDATEPSHDKASSLIHKLTDEGTGTVATGETLYDNVSKSANGPLLLNNPVPSNQILSTAGSDDEEVPPLPRTWSNGSGVFGFGDLEQSTTSDQSTFVVV